MALVQCPECRGKVSTVAQACPHCGMVGPFHEEESVLKSDLELELNAGSQALSKEDDEEGASIDSAAEPRTVPEWKLDDRPLVIHFKIEEAIVAENAIRRAGNSGLLSPSDVRQRGKVKELRKLLVPVPLFEATITTHWKAEKAEIGTLRTQHAGRLIWKPVSGTPDDRSRTVSLY